MAKETLSNTKKFKKATTRITQDEIKKAKYNFVSPKILILEILFAVVVGLTLSYGYLYSAQ